MAAILAAVSFDYPSSSEQDGGRSELSGKGGDSLTATLPINSLSIASSQDPVSAGDGQAMSLSNSSSSVMQD